MNKKWKVRNVSKRTTYYVELMDAGGYIRSFRTDGQGDWEELMGMSWETVYNSYRLECSFQEWRKDRQEDYRYAMNTRK
jgi:hypothetical protein